MAKTNNPFMDTDFNELFDVSKYQDAFKATGVEAQTFLDAQRKNFEALTQANRVAFEGMQAVAQRQSEIVRQTMEEFSKSMSAISSETSPERRLAKQTEMTKESFELALKNMRELSEMSAKSQNEALELLNKRVTESLDELSKAITDLTKQTKSGGASKK